MEAIQVLLVEDNPADVYLTKEALKEADSRMQLHVVNDGQQATDFLFRRHSFALAITPDIILLDLHLPVKDGLEVLQEIKTDPGLRRIPVIVLTSSELERDIEETHSLDAACYISKPVQAGQLVETIKLIHGLHNRVPIR